MTGTCLTLWLWTGALPDYVAGSELTIDLGDWRCQPDVSVHRAGEPVQTLGGDDTPEGGATLPGFSMSVQELFPA